MLHPHTLPPRSMYRTTGGEDPREDRYSHITIDQAAAPDQEFTDFCERLAHLDRKYGGWKSYWRARMRLVVADRHIPYEWGHDVYPGQICVALETASLGAGKRFDGFHVVRYWDPKAGRTVERIAHVQRVLKDPQQGDFRLSWSRKHDELIVSPDEVTFVASVIGMYSGDDSPVLWMYAN